MKLIARMALPVGMACAASGADASVTFITGGGVTYQNNLFRANRDTRNLDGTRRRGSDVVYSVDAGAVVDAHPGEFEISATANVGHDFYQRNSRLDNTNYSVGGAVARTQGNLQFNLQASINRFLSSFGDIQNQVGNRQTLKSVTGQLTYPITPEFRVVARPQYLENSNSSGFISGTDYRQYGGTLGLGYFTALGNSVSISAGRRQTDGLNDLLIRNGSGTINPTRIDTADTLITLNLIYNFSAFTQIQIDGNYVNRNDKSALANDYKGPAGTATFYYQPSSALQFSLRAGRRLETQSQIFVTSVRTDLVEGAVTYTPADRLLAVVRAQYSHRRLAYDPTEFIQTATRLDNTTSFVGEVHYRVLNRVDLGAQVAHYFRTSNLAGRDFNATTVGGTIRLVFGPGAINQTSIGFLAPDRGVLVPRTFRQR